MTVGRCILNLQREGGAQTTAPSRQREGGAQTTAPSRQREGGAQTTVPSRKRSPPSSCVQYM